MTSGDADRLIRVALEGELADTRRAAINKLAGSRYCTEENVRRVLDLVARTDSEETVRRAAVTGLVESEAPNAIETMLTLLGHSDESAATRRAGDQLRWDAIVALIQLVEQDEIDETTMGEIGETTVRVLVSDPARDVRLFAARLLGHCPSQVALAALIDALRRSDFGVVYEAEQSLTRLTGQHFGHDHRRWRAWLDATVDPFARPDIDPNDKQRRRFWPWKKKASQPAAS